MGEGMGVRVPAVGLQLFDDVDGRLAQACALQLRYIGQRHWLHTELHHLPQQQPSPLHAVTLLKSAVTRRAITQATCHTMQAPPYTQSTIPRSALPADPRQRPRPVGQPPHPLYTALAAPWNCTKTFPTPLHYATVHCRERKLPS